MLRPSWTETWLRVADVVADRSTCLKYHVGACLVDQNNQVVSTGYNGAPRGQPHCTECIRIKRGIPSGEQYELCESIHAEMNCLLQAGQRARGCTLFLVVKSPDGIIYHQRAPCFMCSKFLIQNGVDQVYIMTGTKENPGYVTVATSDVYRENRREKGMG